jgi:phosphopantetheine adenylyltransferase/dephospho-CoA kinase
MIESVATRIDRVRQFLGGINPGLHVVCVPIDDGCGPTITEPGFDAILASSETLSGCRYINTKRHERGWHALEIVIVARGNESTLSSTAIRQWRQDQENEMMVVGVTGGIATGKSTVIKTLAAQGATVIDADKIGHSAYRKGTQCFQDVVQAFSFAESIVGEDGEVNRRVLGPLVFGDSSKMDLLNSIVWPAIRTQIEAELQVRQAAGDKLVVIEAAVLLEAGWQDMLQSLWVICVEPEVACTRIMSRNGFSAEESMTRVNFQMNNDQRIAKAGERAVVIWNNGTLTEFEAKINEATGRSLQSSL